MSLHLISGVPGIAGIRPTGSQTLQEKGMNLPVQAAMTPMHLTSPCSSQNMAPGALIYVKNAIGGINEEIFREVIVQRAGAMTLSVTLRSEQIILLFRRLRQSYSASSRQRAASSRNSAIRNPISHISHPKSPCALSLVPHAKTYNFMDVQLLLNNQKSLFSNFS